MAGTLVTQQPPVLLRQMNQVQVMGYEESYEKVVLEEAVTKDVAEESDASTAQYIYHRPGNSKEKWKIY